MYKLIENSPNLIFDILGTTLKNRNIKDIERFLDPSHEDEIHYSNLKNMSDGVKMFVENEGGGSGVTVLIDSDSD